MEQTATRYPWSTQQSLDALYDARFEHDACGVGFVVRSHGGQDHGVVQAALTALGRLAHRGAVAADGRSGDGAGILTQIPRRLIEREAERYGWRFGEGYRCVVGMLFLPADDDTPEQLLATALREQGVEVVGWRAVPVDATALGESARASMPRIRQVIGIAPCGIAEAAIERRLYVARKQFEREASGGYICSLSCRTVVYKALCAGRQLARFYSDLQDPLYESALAVFHQRYSTNTLPAWHLAQPFRLLAHNGEINTLWGNRAWMRARERELDLAVKPLLTEGGSDSASLDEALELLTRGGRELDHALAMLIVPSWEERTDLPRALAAFYRYHASLMEPWDGPAALALSDGRLVCAALDRNGLRPCRYQVGRDGTVVAGSEVGLFDQDDDEVVEKGRLGPGQILLVDLDERRVLHDDELRARLSSRHAYEELLGARRFGAEQLLGDPHPTEQGLPLSARHHLFGVTGEDLKFVLEPMAAEAKEPTWSMGDDTPVPPLARSPRSLYTFLRQRFAQVTNPPIDPLREAGVMSLRSWIGPRPALLDIERQATSFELDSPVLPLAYAAALRQQPQLKVAEVHCTLDPSVESLPAALDRICAQAETAVLAGAELLILSDRSADHSNAPTPMALAVGAVHQQLVRSALRVRAGLIVEAGDCWDVHHLAVLVGYGAGAVCPWLALHSARAANPESGEAALVQALELGLRKVLSKMGISTVASYRAGQLFEVLGLADEVVDRCFTGTPNRIGGLGWEQLQQAVATRHAAAVAAAAAAAKLPDYGLVRFRRSPQAEQHAWQPTTVRALQRAVGQTNDAEQDAAAWEEFRGVAGGTQSRNLRDLLDFVAAGPAVPVEEVEPASSIVRRFVVSAMSLGALSPEAHLTLTIAMNRLGARSNTGEGGEDPVHYLPRADGDRADCKVKQVASGRFGVTAEYLARADELEIKIAQGSKPGEGGQLPGHKVTELIARLRHAQPGLPLISPPPHHDIYSIEDIAQLIYDLKRCNPRAAVGVKLVAEVGVGTVAAGVAKAHADYVVISGHSGGTGASPLSSIKHAGAPWELGLAETQQVLMRNGLRGRIRVRTDGGLMTASDVLVAALLGADEFSFGTAPLVALGCDMARQCHLNTCPTGIATQQPELRAKFRGTPERVVRYFLMLAEDVRQLLALLGLRSLAEATGRADLLRQVRFTGGLDLAPLLACGEGDARRNVLERNSRLEDEEPLDEALLRQAEPAIATGAPFRAECTIRNADRTVGARIAGEVALRAAARDAGSIDLRFTGSAGQSFGAFCGTAMRLELTGAANDYVGKGLCGAELVLRPAGAAANAPHRNVILGNVALYGATSGRLFAAGIAGERFAVRNSGACAVVEGVGDHGCEYMTGGVVVVLGQAGRNFGAGMTGGVAYVYDETGDFPARVNAESVGCRRPDDEDFATLLELLKEHATKTGSVHAARLALHWEETSRRFWRVEARTGVTIAVAQAVATESVSASPAQGQQTR